MYANFEFELELSDCSELFNFVQNTLSTTDKFKPIRLGYVHANYKIEYFDQ